MPIHHNLRTKVAIIGTGPSGCAASYELSKNGIEHILIDKAIFPRDKVCGDGLSPSVFYVLRKIYPELIAKMAAQTDKFKPMLSGMGVAPNGVEADMPLYNPAQDDLPPAFSAKRIDFDHFLVNQLNTTYATAYFGYEVTDIVRHDNGFTLTIKDNNAATTMQIDAEVLIGADGDRSIVKKKLTSSKLNNEHYLAGIRAYYSGVTGMKNRLEFHLFSKVLPGYFWIFPLANGQANVGVCMLSSYIGKNKVNLREILLKAIQEEPTLKTRFANATLDGKIVGWGLPVGSNPKKVLSGERFLLIGDAASVINPLSGEGIAPAFYTGMYAAQAIVSAKGDYSAAVFQQSYDSRIARTMGFEFRLMRWLQGIYHYPRLLNFLLGSFAHNTFLIENCGVFFDQKSRKALYNPMFSLRMLVGFFGIKL